MMIALLVAPTTVSAQARDSESASHRVVILNTADPYLPAFLALDRGLREAITRAEHGVPTELYAETLDMFRFPRTLLAEDVVALLRKKYHDLKVDVIVAAGSIAFDFAQRYRAEIWPGAAIVFHSVPAASLEKRGLDPHMIGVPSRLEFGQTLDLALRLRPTTRRVVVVAGIAEPDSTHLSLMRTLLEHYAGKLEIQYLTGLTLAETIAAVGMLPSDAIVLYLTMFRDGDGVPLVPRDVLTQVAAVSRAPVFGVHETYLGHGIAAGSIASYAAQGRRAGELVARVLNGADPSAIGAQAPVESGCIADWRQLRHWGIDEALLPADCEVRFKEVTTWDRYYGQILAALAVILVQTSLIAALLLHRRRLRRAQTTLADEYARRTRAEGLAARLRERLARFGKERSLGTMATLISHEINQPLIAIQNYAQAAKRRLQNNVDDKPKLIELFAKIEEQAERAGTITQRVRSLVGTSDVRLLVVSLHPLVEEVIRMMEPEIEHRECRIAYEPASDLPTILADSLQVQLVLVNLLRNAMRSICSNERYDKRISIDADAINDREVQVSVMDWGHGVPPDRVADIFEPLYSGTSGGMGMGLAISQAIIEAHGGRLWYEPNPTGGAIFRFTLRGSGS
ncbi:MAG TPA: ABC transporter substrate binding protein [Candidatus Competibacter sp.]|nr:ABC transporter substrate binding protein [Candidatus Competibacter sp.]